MGKMARLQRNGMFQKSEVEFLHFSVKISRYIILVWNVQCNEGFAWWCITLSITGYLDFAFSSDQTTTFWKQDLFLSTGENVGRHLHSWVFLKELIPISGLKSITWIFISNEDQVLSVGDNKKICSRNCGDPHECVKLRHKRKAKINNWNWTKNPTQKHECWRRYTNWHDI
jgi:hypothetical protein